LTVVQENKQVLANAIIIIIIIISKNQFRVTKFGQTVKKIDPLVISRLHAKYESYHKRDDIFKSKNLGALKF
jgi:hypothetical protein